MDPWWTVYYYIFNTFSVINKKNNIQREDKIYFDFLVSSYERFCH